MLPGWLAENPDAIQTGSLALDQLLQVLLGTSMVLAFLIGFLLDNTIPGNQGLDLFQAELHPNSVCHF